MEHARTSLAAIQCFSACLNRKTLVLIEEDSKKHLEALWRFSLCDWAAALGKDIKLQGAVNHHSISLRGQRISASVLNIFYNKRRLSVSYSESCRLCAYWE